MKKVMILGLTTLSLVVFPHVVAAQEKETVVATAGDIKPFSYENGGKLTGYDIEVLKAADKYMTNYRFSFKKTAWESIFVGLDSGHYQVAANNLSYTEARATKYRYSLPIAANPLVLVVPEESDIKSLDDYTNQQTQEMTFLRLPDPPCSRAEPTGANGRSAGVAALLSCVTRGPYRRTGVGCARHGALPLT